MSDGQTPLPKPEKRAVAAFELWRKTVDNKSRHPLLPEMIAEAEAAAVEALGYESVAEYREAVEAVHAWITDPNRPPSWYQRMNQGVSWWDREGRCHAIAEMPATYRAAVVAFLRRRAVGIEFQYGWGEALTVDAHIAQWGAPDDFDIPCHDDDWPMDYSLKTDAGRAQHEALCVAWLEGTRLVRSLRVGADAAYEHA